MARDGLSVIEKVTMIIQRFLDERETSLGFNQILSGTPLSRGTAHRLLSDLTEQGLLSQDAHRDEYRLGPLLVSAGALAQEASNLALLSIPKMEALRDEFGETVVLSELHHDAVIPVRRVDGVHEMRMNQELGRRYPAYAGATGQVLLAHEDPERLAEYLGGLRIKALTATTVSSVKTLRHELERIRRAGLGISLGQRVPEALAIAAPIFDRDGGLCYALTISGVASRWDRERTMAGARAVKASAEALSRESGYRPPDDAPVAADLEKPRSEPATVLREFCDELWPSKRKTKARG
jgi:DNA-binding IclR family transcriptional regulator